MMTANRFHFNVLDCMVAIKVTALLAFTIPMLRASALFVLLNLSLGQAQWLKMRGHLWQKGSETIAQQTSQAWRHTPVIQAMWET
jgi:hypothetical protein